MAASWRSSADTSDRGVVVVAAVGLLLSDSLSSSLDEDDEDGDDAHRLRVFLPDDSVC